MRIPLNSITDSGEIRSLIPVFIRSVIPVESDHYLQNLSMLVSPCFNSAIFSDFFSFRPFLSRFSSKDGFFDFFSYTATNFIELAEV